MLLTHDAPFEAYPDLRGSPLIRDVIKECQPVFHIFGHVHVAEGRHEFNVPGTPTRSWLLENVTFGKNLARSLAGSMAILEWDGKEGDITLVKDAWLSQMRFHIWMSVWPEKISNAKP
ncbi:MAG: hypothetical protein HY360_27015 [Verrucomicrobia bacterium]|nr:hypothetical protein [Verrucomicrobiota bacterium]